MNFVKNNERQRKLIRRFHNMRTDGQTERPTDRNNVTNCGYVKPQLNVHAKHCKINFFKSLLDYTAIYQQKQSAQRARQNYCTVGIDSLS
jgi:activator of 2-hydroxyglutaryl-CoA dehydratase